MLFNTYFGSFGFLTFLVSICILAAVCSISFNTDEFSSHHFFVHGTSADNVEGRPHVNDKNLNAIVVAEGLKHPTSMAFLGPNDFVVLEKKTGMVKRILNGTISEKPLLDVEVANEKERGMLGVAISVDDNQSGGNFQKENDLQDHRSTKVFLYYTESSGKDGNDDCPLINYCRGATEPKGNRLYRYDLEADKLSHPKLLLDLPAGPGSDHLGGAVVLDPDRNVYLTTGDGDSCSYHSCDKGVKDTVLNSETANVKGGSKPDGRGGILRITQDGQPVSGDGRGGIFHEKGILGKYYAYGIRNSYGIDFDPLSGKLWDTENGPSFGDEINLVEPAFNSGWMKIQGIWPISNKTLLYPQGLIPPYRGYFVGNNDEFSPDKGVYPKELVDFQGRGKYSDPEFIWNMTVGVTAIKFLGSDKLGEKYKDDLFVADSNNGNLYHFDLNTDRTKLVFNGSVTDKIVHSLQREELDPILFGEGFDSITDLEVGPDGYLYVVSYKQGKIFKIVPTSNK